MFCLILDFTSGISEPIRYNWNVNNIWLLYGFQDVIQIRTENHVLYPNPTHTHKSTRMKPRGCYKKELKSKILDPMPTDTRMQSPNQLYENVINYNFAVVILERVRYLSIHYLYMGFWFNRCQRLWWIGLEVKILGYLYE